MESKRLNILIVAHEFSPFGGSECGVGWNIVTRMTKYHDVTVIYASGSQFNDSSYVNAVKKYLETGQPLKNLTLINLDQPLFTKVIASINSYFIKLSPIGLPLLYYIGYKYWQKAVFHKARKLHILQNYHIVHQLTQITFREPGYLWKLDIPFFWGPTGGTSTFPKSFNRILSLHSRILDRIRSISAYYQFRFSPRVKKAMTHASFIYTFSKIDEGRFKLRANGEIKVMLDVGTYLRINEKPDRENNGTRLIAIWCGRLDEFKAPIILLKAIAASDMIKNMVTFKIIGTGPLASDLRNKANQLKLGNIEWIGRVTHDEVFSLMGNADFFVHTSIREATSSVIPEALSKGLPVICHNAFGMGIAVNESCGIRVPLETPEKSIVEFRRAIESLISDRQFLKNLKVGAVKRTEDLSWDNMVYTIAVDYLNTVLMTAEGTNGTKE